MTKSKALTPREKMKAFRERRRALGLKEVRGIWLPDNLHVKIKKMADKLNQEI